MKGFTVEDTTRTILLVDDEENILSSLQRLLRRENYNVITNASPEKALEILKHEPVSLIISDQRMPEMDGTEFLEKAGEIQPEAIRIILTGYADISAAMAAINQGQVYRFVTKPWNDLDLKATIGQAIDFYNLRQENQRLFDLTVRQNAELKDLNENLEKKVEERTQEIKRLYKELQSSYFKTIRIFTDLMQMYDPALGGHVKRVAVLSRLLAEKCDLQGEELDVVEAAGSLHDVGLIGIPREIIRKKGSERTAAEEALYRQHPNLGYTILNLAPKLDQVSILVKSHHEWFDGAGYPDRLKKEEIPLGARIIAVADGYDHLLARGGISKEDALFYLRKLAGSALDPVVVSVAVKVLSTIKTADRAEVAVTLADLQPDMVLARELRTHTGRLLMPKDAVLKEAYLEKVKKFHEIDPIVGWIYVYR
ncbi:MAG: response regulator [Deltaproteobacteria bacterium]|nr:MAG: response regulator [Deltaproteobacteria bacterium]